MGFINKFTLDLYRVNTCTVIYCDNNCLHVVNASPVPFKHFIWFFFLYNKPISGIVSTWAGSGSAGFADGQGVNATFNSPLSIAINQTDSCLYVSDYNNHKIREVTPQGEYMVGV